MKDISPWRIRRLAESEEIEPEYVYASETDEVHLNDYWKILVKRRRMILVLFLLIFAVGAYFTFSPTRLYTATATVKIEPQNPQVTGVGILEAIQGGGGGPYDYYQTQFALLQSRPLAARVITSLGLESNKSFTHTRVVIANPVMRVMTWVFRLLGYFSYYVEPLFVSDTQYNSRPIKTSRKLAQEDVELNVAPGLIGRYLAYLDVKPVRNTRLVKISFATPDPVLSQALANTHVEGFMRMSLESRFSLTREAREFLDQKKIELRRKLESSEEALNNYRRTHGVVSVDKGENIIVDRLVDLNRQLTAARTQRIEAESLYRTVENRNYQDLSEIMRQGLVQQLRSNIANLEAERTRLSTIFKPDHPRIQDLSQQIAEARRSVNAEIANVVRGIRSNYAAALAKERALEAEAEKQQGNALKLKELGVQYTILQEDVNANKALYENVLKRLSETNVSNDIAVSNMQITERAEMPFFPSTPNTPLYLLVTIILGAGLAVGMALFREYLDSTVSTPDDVWRLAGLSTLGVVPHLKFLNRRTYSSRRLDQADSRRQEPSQLGSLKLTRPTAKDLIISQSPMSIISESYRTIRTALLLSQAEKPPQVVLLTSPAPGEGKTVTTLNLAIALAHDGHSVLVIDGDMRKGCCHSRLGLRNNKGLSNVLTGGLALEEGIQETSVSGLSLLCRGVLPPNPTELLGSRKMKEVLQELRRSYKFILIDCPPVIAVSDAAVLSIISDGVLLVFDGHTTTAASAKKALERLDVVRAKLLGVVLNSVNLDDPDYSYYRSYSSYYGSAREEESDQEQADDEVRGVDKVIHVSEAGIKEEKWDIGTGSDLRRNPRKPLTDEAGCQESIVDESLRPDMENGKMGEELDDAKLPQSELVEEWVSTEKQAAPAQEILPSQSIDRIVQALSDSIGPIAPLIVRDRIALMGESQDAFPKTRLRELLRAISGEIAHEKLRIRFEKRISQEIRDLEKL